MGNDVLSGPWCRPVARGAAGKDKGRGRMDGTSNNKPAGPPGIDPASDDEDWDEWGDWGEPKVLSDWVDEAQAARRNGKTGTRFSRRGRCVPAHPCALAARSYHFMLACRTHAPVMLRIAKPAKAFCVA